MEMTLTGYQMVAGMALLCASIASLIVLVKWYWRRNQPTSIHKSIAHRTKYKSIDFLRQSGRFLKVGMVAALAMMVLAFSWTSYERPIVEGFTYTLEEDIDLIPPITKEKKKLPPPLPPVKIEIPDEPIEVDESPTFVDMEVEDAPIEPVPTPKPIKPAEKPAPLPVPEIEEQPEFVLRAAVMPRICSSCDATEMDQKAKNKCAGIELLRLVQSTVKYPSIARENRVEGVCAVQFRITEDGQLSHVQLLKDIGAGCGQAVLQAMEDIKEQCWHPGRQNGRPVAVQMTLPVRFKLE